MGREEPKEAIRKNGFLTVGTSALFVYLNKKIHNAVKIEGKTAAFYELLIRFYPVWGFQLLYSALMVTFSPTWHLIQHTCCTGLFLK